MALNRTEIGMERSYEIDLYDTIEDVPPAWDYLSEGHSFFISRAYLQLLERNGPWNQRYRYGVVTKAGLPVVAVKTVIFDVNDDMLSVRDRTSFNGRQRPMGRFLDKGKTRIRNRTLSLFGRRVILCGNLFSCGQHGIAFGQHGNPAEHWPAVLETLQKIQQVDGKASYLVIKDVTQPDVLHQLQVLNLGFTRLQMEPSMDLHAPLLWRAYPDYFESLNTKYRKAARKIIDRVQDWGAVIESGVDPCPVQNRLFELYAQVERRAQIRFGLLKAGYLPALAEMAGPERFRCSLIRKDNEIAGFSAVVKDGDMAVAHFVGFDYETNTHVPIYLRLLHQIIEDALFLNCRVIHYGRTALEPKARLGATPTNTEAWIKHCQPPVNRMLSCILRLVREDKAPSRNPFR